VLGFGASADALDGTLFDGRVEVLRLLREPPGGGDSLIVSAWTDDATLAEHVARRLGGIAFVAEVAASVLPPGRPWTPA
jgi:hypothetical protein